MKCIVSSARYGDLINKTKFFKLCDYIKRGKVKDYWWSKPKDKRLEHTREYIEGDINFIFEKLKEISDVVKSDQFVLTFRDDGDIEAMIYDDYIE